MKYEPINPIAEFVDEFGDTQIIHKPKGRGLRQFKGEGTPLLKVNRAVAVLLGQKIRARRVEMGMSMHDLGVAAGIKSATPKQYIYSIEKAVRKEGVRLGTLMLIAGALDLEPGDLLPSVGEAMNLAGVTRKSVSVLT